MLLVNLINKKCRNITVMKLHTKTAYLIGVSLSICVGLQAGCTSNSTTNSDFFPVVEWSQSSQESIPQSGVAFMNRKKEIVISPQSGISNARKSSQGLARILVDNKWGYINKEGNIVIIPQFENAGDFSEGLAAIVINGKLGYINKQGDMVIQPQFEYQDHAWDWGFHRFSEGLALIRKDNKVGYINNQGLIVISPKFDDAYPFSDGVALILDEAGYGYIDINGQVIVEPQFEDAGSFSEGLAPVRIGDRIGYINTNSEIVINPNFTVPQYYHPSLPEYYDLSIYGGEVNFQEGMAKVQVNKKDGYINNKGEIVIDPQFTKALPFSEGLAAVMIENDKLGYINKQGQVVFEMPINPWEFFYPSGSSIPGQPNFSGGFVWTSELVYFDKEGNQVPYPSSLPPEEQAKIDANEAKFEARNNLGALNRAQQAFFLENGKFASSIRELGVGIREETDYHSYAIEGVISNAVIMTVTGKKSGMTGFTGVVLVKNQDTTAYLCVPNDFSQTPPAVSIDNLQLQNFRCPSGSHNP